MGKAWYPVIDYLECAECGACVKKCSHRVYDATKAPTPVIANPEACVEHCHGCGNLCPQGAITYIGEDSDWVPPHGAVQEQAESCCCCSGMAAKQLTVDFLYLDLNTCERCMATDSTLDEAVTELSEVLHTLGYEIVVNKVNIKSREMAKHYRFLSSPTICVNGKDICMDVKENACKDCGDICGSDTECRVFVYDGIEYNFPPKAMIIDGILKILYGSQVESREDSYILPKNLETFFAGIQKTCCDTACGCTEECQ